MSDERKLAREIVVGDSPRPRRGSAGRRSSWRCAGRIPWSCGGAGIHSLLPGAISLISGPGCPVCVTPSGYVDNAIALAESGRAMIATFGDMLKVPGMSGRSLSGLSGHGAREEWFIRRAS